MSVEVEGLRTPRRAWSLDTIVWALLLALLVPAWVALRELPWAGALLAWTLPVAMGGGVVLGALLVGATIPRRWWWTPLAATIILGLAAVAGGALAVHTSAASALQPVSVLVCVYAAALAATVPWLVFRARLTWVGVVLVWATVAGIWRSALSPQRVWWVVALLAVSLTLMGLAHLREQQLLWNALRLERLGPVLWPSARTVVGVSLLVAVIGLLPLGAVELAALQRVFSLTPFASAGPLTYDSPRGTPVPVLGAPLALNAPDTAGSQKIVSYQVLQGPNFTPPLLGATLDRFDGSAWSQGPSSPAPAPAYKPLQLTGINPAQAGPATPAPSPGGSALAQSAQGPQQLQVKVTVYAMPRTPGAALLLGFAQPTGFSVAGTSVRVAGTGASDPLGITQWEAPSALAPGSTYLTSGVLLPPDVAGDGSLPPGLQARLTAVPSDLAPQLKATAEQWTASSGSPRTPSALAAALLTAMQAHLKLVPNAVPPAGVNGVAWFLQNGRGNVLLWTTTYILLGRSLGLPLRLAEGYLPGTYDTKLQAMVVRASDATVWAQLAVPGKGWLDLFPGYDVQTIEVPNRIVYLNDTTPTPTPKPTPTPNAQQQPAASRTPYQPGSPAGLVGSTLVTILLIVLIVLLALTGLVAFLNYRWRRYGAQLGPLAQLFARVALLARLGGVRLRPSDTATQATAKVGTTIPDQAPTLVQLNGLYERLRYGPPVTAQLAGTLPNLREQWRRLGGSLWRLVLSRPLSHRRRSSPPPSSPPRSGSQR